MRRVLYILLAAVALPLSAAAQVSKQVEVSKDYAPSVSAAQKMAIVPFRAKDMLQPKSPAA